jgi:hypothetical protein
MRQTARRIVNANDIEGGQVPFHIRGPTQTIQIGHDLGLKCVRPLEMSLVPEFTSYDTLAYPSDQQAAVGPTSKLVTG